MPTILRRVRLPEPPEPEPCPELPAQEYESRVERLRAGADWADWIVVYGDREHAANLAFLSGFDPRFEEALLVLGPGGRRVLVVGNEGLGYVSQSALRAEVALCQSFSLMGQSRAEAPRLAGVLRALGLGTGARVGVVGWKYLEPAEADDPAIPAFVPALLLETLRALVGPAGAIRDVTALLMHPERGLKHQCGAAQIALQAWAAARASSAVQRIIRGARPGMTEREAAGLMGYQGEPLSCHVMLAAGAGPIVGLRSPGDRTLAAGDGITTAVGYHGGLCCRAGLLRDQPDESFFTSYVAPYFAAQTAWYGAVRIGAAGGAIEAAVLDALAGVPFRPALNPGHLIAIDEWSHTPIRPGSAETIRSGMVLQCDIIPAPLPDGLALNCEDTVAIADAGLRAELAASFPALWRAIEARRSFMREALGIALADEVLPLSTAPACLPPFWLDPELVCAAG